MARLSPFHSRTYALCRSYSWKEWAAYIAVSNYDRHSEREYFAIRNTAGLLDVSPLYKYEITGPGAADFLAQVWTRDIRKLRPGRVVYGCMLDEEGYLLDDGTVACLQPEHYRVTSSESWFAWYERQARGFDIQIEDSTHRLAALALQGPASRDILRGVVGSEIDDLRFFGLRETSFGDRPLCVTRTGYTGDLGYELWTPKQYALALWDAVVEAGGEYGLEPVGLDALDVTRIEAGFVLQGVDYISARACSKDSRKSTPFDAGLGWTVKLEREGFIGREALLRVQEKGPVWDLVGLEVSWPAIERLYDEYDYPPHLAPVACRQAVPVYDSYGLQVGQATSTAWSPTTKRYLALAQIKRDYSKLGTELRIEHTVEFERRELPARVVETPFFDPPRKTFTPPPADAATSEAPAQEEASEQDAAEAGKPGEETS
ncbi:MAG: aminomethyltransferase family protein [Myxococcota bacterium]|nr:aminomethyltransferase family protein [Myxococcota bacterium]